MAVGLMAPPVLAATAATVHEEHGSVQALLVAFGALAEGVSPLAFGLMLDATAGSSWPGLPFAVGGATALLGWSLASMASHRQRWMVALQQPLTLNVAPSPMGLRL